LNVRLPMPAENRKPRRWAGVCLLALAVSAWAQTPEPPEPRESPITPAPSAAQQTPSAAAAPARAPASSAPERLQVSDPFLEMHTGPGRGYPVFHVVERGQRVTVEMRRTDWYRVRAEGGQVGWVPRRQLELTLTEAGATKSFRDILVDDFVGRRVEFGGAWGRFKAEPMLKLWTQVRLAETVGVELGVAQVQGVFSGTDFWSLSLTSEPWSDRRLSPFFSVGLGQFRNIPNSSLVNAVPTDARLAHATLGLRWYLGERFVARLDGSLYTAFVADNRSIEYRAFTAGLAFFF
jgi:hypothetical protein